jgi:hypothetical protein
METAAFHLDTSGTRFRVDKIPLDTLAEDVGMTTMHFSSRVET